MPVNPETVAYESLRISDIRFAYHRAGHGGVPIVLLHGWPQTSWAWRRVTPLLSPLCDVVVPDLPGFGYSSKPEGGFDKKTIARRLRDFVQALGLSRIALVGDQLVARFEQARRSAVGQAHGMGRNRGGQACDATMCVVVRRYRHGAGERDHGAMAGDETKVSKRVISFGSSAED
jgi:hypothetical protein